MPTDGGAAQVKLNGRLVAGGGVLGALLGPDGSRVVYHADQDRNDVFEVFSAPVDGSAGPVKLSDPSSFVQLDTVRISPDGTRVAYVADEEANPLFDLFELYTVPIDGSASPVRVSGALVSGGDVEPDFQFSPDGSWLVYRADQVLNNRIELFSVPADGSLSARRLNTTLANDRDVKSFGISPDGERVVYIANQNAFQNQELHSVPIDGSSPAVALEAGLTPGVFVFAFELSPGGGYVVYSARHGSSAARLFRVPIAGGEPREVNGPMLFNRSVVTSVPGSFRTSPDGSRVLYLADQEVDERIELFGTLVAHGPLARAR